MKRNSNFDILKFFLIISVMCAHLSPVSNASFFNTKISILFNSVGCLGVSIFFVIAGYFFYNNGDSFLSFWKKKFSSIMIPWFLVGSFVYISVYYFNNALSIDSYLSFIIGYGSYLYYLLVLVLLYLFYFKLKHHNTFICITTILSIISIILTIVVGYNKTSYINIFNWMFYFNIGIIINKCNIFNKVNKICSNIFPICLLLLVLIFMGHLYFSVPIGYWTPFGPLCILLNMIFLFGIIQKKDLGKFKSIIYIGKNSLAFYLLHMPIAGIVVRITNYYNYSGLLLLRPLFTLVLTLIIIYVCDIIIEKTEIYILKKCIGIR